MQLDELTTKLHEVANTASPQVAAVAQWALDHQNDLPFKSIRAVASAAGSNTNTVVRFAKTLGFDRYESFRQALQQSISTTPIAYAQRAQVLGRTAHDDVYHQLQSSAQANLDAVFNPHLIRTLESCAEPLLQARRVYSVGVRSCYSVAHYFAYVGSVAFENVMHSPAQPGGILDEISQCTEDDILVAISYEHYSTEVIRACKMACASNARIIALTDKPSSPIAECAWKVVTLPMTGPQYMPSLSAAFLVIDTLLAQMLALKPQAAERVQAFEERIRTFGGYV